MASLKVLRRRIRSITSTQQITKAMEMVAAAKLRRAQARAQATRPYAARLTAMLERVAAVARERELADPVLAAPAAGAEGTTLLVVVTSDRGMCGGFNTTLFRVVEERLRTAAPGTLALVVVGRKGRDYGAGRGWPVTASYTDVGTDAGVDFARRVTGDVLGRFRAAGAAGGSGGGGVVRVELLYTHFVTVLRREVAVETFLPVGARADAAAPPPAGDVLLEPDLGAVLTDLLPRFATARMLAALADSRASEEGARMTAMGAASKNAGELLDALVLQRNRLRQTTITREILDIVGGAEALA
jgi:F-type H+-transporting ATPase subunit gamma